MGLHLQARGEHLVRVNAGCAVGTPAELPSPAVESWNRPKKQWANGAKISFPMPAGGESMAQRLQDSEFYSEELTLAGHMLCSQSRASMNSKKKKNPPSACLYTAGAGKLWAVDRARETVRSPGRMDLGTPRWPNTDGSSHQATLGRRRGHGAC